VLAALVCVFNFLVTGLEYNLMPEIAGMLAGAAIFASVIILLLIHGIWIAADCFGGLPVSQLRLFVDDLSCLLVEGHGRRPPFALVPVVGAAPCNIRVTLTPPPVSSMKAPSCRNRGGALIG
jgi:hypothetical protein